MPAILFLLPALVAQAPLAPATLDQLQDLLEAIPEAVVDGKTANLKALLAKARTGWDKAKPELRKTIPEAEATFIDRQLKAMEKMSPREKAAGAIGISSTLSRFQPRSPKQDLQAADRTAMLAWCSVDAGLWQQIPRVAEAFKPVLDQDKGRHPLAVASAGEALQRFQTAVTKKQAPTAKKALKELLALVDVLEKP